MKLDPRHLEILAAIVDHGGLTEGAHAIGKSQPSVSRSLAMLEERLGVALFEPSRRPLKPTEFCLLLAQEGRRINLAGRAASTLIQQFKGGLSGAVRVAGTPIFMDGVVSPILATFQSEFPDIRINQSYGYAGEILAQLGNETLDVGLVPIRASEVPSQLQAHQILPGRNVIACRVGHPLARKSTVKLSEIARYSWIAPPPESPLYHDLRAVLDGIGVKDFKVSFSGGSLTSVTNVLSNSDALTVLPYSVVFMLRRQNSLAALSIRIGDPDRNLCIVTSRTSTEQPAISRLVRFIRNEFKSMDVMIQRHEQNNLWRK
jgi:DNA-binding transcriptional LysR family regulator